MNEQELRTLVTSTGVQLLEEGLLVRTWGNISCRLDAEHMLITPSGLDYKTTTPADLPVVHLPDLEWTGTYKPSSEKGIHAAAYGIFPEAGFVIHTHQAWASAIAVYGIGEMDITPEEQRLLGGLAQASYGLPGTKTLRRAVEESFRLGAHTVLMQNHGVVIAAENRDEAVERARLLEEICRRNCRGIDHEKALASVAPGRQERLGKYMRKLFPNLAFVTDDAVVLQAAEGKTIPAQLDDMAQMIGSRVRTVRRASDTIDELRKYHAVLIPGVGGAVAGDDADDTEALAALLSKAALAARHTEACEVKRKLSAADCRLMHLIYQKKYSKKKHAADDAAGNVQDETEA